MLTVIDRECGYWGLMLSVDISILGWKDSQGRINNYNDIIACFPGPQVNDGDAFPPASSLRTNVSAFPLISPLGRFRSTLKRERLLRED